MLETKRKVFWIYEVKPKRVMEHWDLDKICNACVQEFSSGKIAIYKEYANGSANPGYRIYSNMMELEIDFELGKEVSILPGFFAGQPKEQKPDVQ